MSIVCVLGARDRSNFKSRADFNHLRGEEIRRLMENLLGVMMEDSPLGANVRQVMQKDIDLVNGVLTKLRDKYGGNLSLISVGCDDGVGAITKATAMALRIRFVELTCHFWDPPVDGDRNRRSRSEYLQFYNARNAYLDEICDEFHLLVNTSRHSMVENLYERVQATTPIRPTIRPYTLYGFDGHVLETNTKENGK